MMLKRLSSWLPYLAVMMIGTCLYWPVMTGLFFLKNDAAVAYFPVRLQMSEAIHQGIIPFWSPYINYGYPLHADFSSGFWNPVVWLCISLFHYRFYTLHLEWMMYVWMGGWGMFRLGKALHFSDAVACAVATAYLGSGYWLGSAEWMNWISPLAWLPWLLALGLLLFRHQRLSHALWLAIVLWCYLSNAHPDQIIWLMYFTAISLLAGWIAYRKSWQLHIPNHAAARRLIKLLLIAALCTGLLLAGMMISLYTAMPYMYRSTPLAGNQLGNPFSPACWISFLFPLATTAPAPWWRDTDMVLRSGYVGSLMWIAAMGFFMHLRKYRAARFWLLQLLCFLVLSAGWLQHLRLPGMRAIHLALPLLHFVRLESAWRLGVVLALCISAGQFLNLLEQQLSFRKTFFALLSALFVVYFSTFLFSLSSIPHLLLFIKEIFFVADKTQAKRWIDSLHLPDKFFIESITGMVLTGLLYLFLRRKKTTTGIVKAVCWMIIADIFLHTQWMMPYTVVGKSAVKQIQRLVDNFPKAYPNPPLIPIQQYDTFPSAISRIIGSKSYYDKRIGSPDQPAFYPNLLSSVRQFYQSGYASCANKTPFLYVSNNIYSMHDVAKACTMLDSSAIFLSVPLPAGYLSDTPSSPASLSLHACVPGLIAVHVSNPFPAMLLCKQNDYPFWKAYDNGDPIPIYRANISFMAVSLSPGDHFMVFRYDPKIIRIGFWLMWCTLAGLITGLIYLSYKSQRSAH